MSNGLMRFKNNISPAFRTGIEQFKDDFAGSGDFFGFNTAAGFEFSGAPNLDLSAACPILILPSSDGRTKVAIDADPDDVQNFRVNKTGDTISLKQNGMSGGSININNVSGNNINISNGRIIIDGVDMTGGFNKKKSTKIPRVLISVPEGGDLTADMSGKATLLSAVFHDEANLDLSGQCKVAVAAKEIGLDTSGQGTIVLNVGGGNFKIDSSGMGLCDVSGEFSDVKLDVSGMSSIRTAGTVKGDYRINAAGMCNIRHTGPIHGNVKKHVAGMANISVG